MAQSEQTQTSSKPVKPDEFAINCIKVLKLTGTREEFNKNLAIAEKELAAVNDKLVRHLCCQANRH